MLKALPTSQTSLPAIIARNLVFIDKTAFISTYEKSQHAVSLFLRPRRFGKTMFTEILKYYYDAALEKESSGIFSSTYIATHPTPLKSTFHVVKFDFSGIDTSGRTRAVLDSFKFKIIQGIDDFFGRYPDTIPGDIRKLALSGEKGELSKAVFKYYGDTSLFPTAGRVTDDFITYLKAFPRKVMVIIDEYDNFTNDILSRDVGAFTEIARKEGDVSKFYQVLRSRQQANIIDRIFITGVLPITLDTSLSGFVSDKIYLDAKFNEMAGFSDTEVAELLEETVDFDKCVFSPDDLRKEMKKRYNGYRFSKFAGNTVYNPALCLNFITRLIDTGYTEIADMQTESGNDMDFEKFSGYLELLTQEALDKLFGYLNSGEPFAAELASSLKITSEREKLTLEQGATLLYHLGFLTMMSREESLDEVGSQYLEGKSYLKIPNAYFEKLFTDYRLSRNPVLWQTAKDSRWAMTEIARVNDLSKLILLLESVAGAFVKNSDARECESQVVLTVYTALSVLTNDSFELTREYSIRHACRHVFEDGLNESEYQDVDENAVEKELRDSGVISEPETPEKTPAEAAADLPDKAPGRFRSRFRKLPKAAVIDSRKGRADLVAINSGNGPSYIFEFKYQRDSGAREETKERVCEILYERAVRQLNFYVTDDRLSKLPDLHKYVIMFAYGEFFIEEVP